MHFLKVGLLFASSTLSRLLAGLIVVKIIAIYIGAQGLGQLGQFMSLMSMITMMAGGGISSGIIKYVAEHQENPIELRRYIGAASMVTVIASLLLGLVLSMAASVISGWLFNTDQYAHVIRVLAIAQIAVAGTNFFFGLVNGQKRVRAFALISATGAVAGALGVAVGSIYYGITGAMYGLIWMPACYFLLLLPWSRFSLRWDWRRFAPTWDKGKIQQYLGFSLMLLVSVLTMQMSQVFIRKIIEGHDSWTGVGYWQATAKISDAYLSFITVVLSNYYLPRLAALRTRAEIGSEVGSVYKFAIPVLLVMAAGVYFFRDTIILVLFSKEFTPMRGFFTWQLIGDTFKIAAYIGGYVAVARANTRIYVAAEIFQASVLVTLCYLFVSRYGAIGATYAYCVNYIIYFLTVQFVLQRYLHRGGAV
jgi:O-antigen/teichoic acid export membrane protein